MTGFLLTPRADERLDEIYAYTADRWGFEQADRYVRGLFGEFDLIARGGRKGRLLAPRYRTSGRFVRWRSHVIYWREIDGGMIEIVTILHVAMDQSTRLANDLPGL